MMGQEFLLIDKNSLGTRILLTPSLTEQKLMPHLLPYAAVNVPRVSSQKNEGDG